MRFLEYREQKQHGSQSFPLQYYYVDKMHPQYTMPLHWHDEFEFIRVKKGRLRLFLNNEPLIGEPGAVFFVSPGTLHRAEPIDCIYECAVFDAKLISGYDVSKMSRYIRPIITGDVEIDAMCSSAKDTVDELFSSISVERDYYELYAVSLLVKIFYELYSSDCVKVSRKKSKLYTHRRAQMILLLEKIGKEYTGKISFSELAETSGINEKYFFKVFKEFTGQTPTEYINCMRVDRACHEMTVNGLSVTDAAYEAGFNELSYFSRVFKRYKGMTPGEYKRRT